MSQQDKALCLNLLNSFQLCLKILFVNPFFMLKTMAFTEN